MSDQLEGICKKAKWCEFGKIYEDDRYIVDRCEHCGKRVEHKKTPEGRLVDNAKFIRAHIRDFVQPEGKGRYVYQEIYGSKALEDFDAFTKNQAERKRRLEDYDLGFDEAMKLGDKKYFV